MISKNSQYEIAIPKYIKRSRVQYVLMFLRSKITTLAVCIFGPVFREIWDSSDLTQTGCEALHHSIPGEWNVRNAIPRHCQKLQNTEDDGQSLFMPPKHRTKC